MKENLSSFFLVDRVSFLTTAKASSKLSSKTVPINTLAMLNVNNFDGLFGTLFNL